MCFKLLEFIFWGVTETVKYVLISYGILGFVPKRDVKRYFAITGYFLILLILEIWDQDTVYLRTGYGFVILFVIFEGKIAKKIQAYLLEFIAISGIDLLLWTLLAGIAGRDYAVYHGAFFIDWISAVLGCIFWVLILVFLGGQRKRLGQGFVQLSPGYFFIIFFVLAGFAFLAGIAQGNILGQLEDGMLELFFPVCAVVVFLTFFFAYIFIRTLYSKKQLELESEFMKKNIELQKKYYEKQLAGDGRIRQFRHDITKHINVLNQLCVKGREEELKEYIKTLAEMTDQDCD